MRRLGCEGSDGQVSLGRGQEQLGCLISLFSGEGAIAHAYAL